MSQLVKTKRQANFKDFKRFRAFKGLVEQKKTRSCVNKLPTIVFPKENVTKREYVIIIC
jgi:hypothetical protein